MTNEQHAAELNRLGVDRERYLTDATYRRVADAMALRQGTPMAARDAFELAVACLSAPNMLERGEIERIYREANRPVFFDIDGGERSR